MSSRAFVVGVLLVTGAGDLALHAGQSAPPVIHNRVDLVSLSVSVADRANQPDPFGSSDDDNSIFVLRQLAERTGGRIFVVRDAQELTDAYRRIHDELQHQYTLAYTSGRPHDGSWRRLQVQVTRAGVLARTKEGYFAPRR